MASTFHPPRPLSAASDPSTGDTARHPPASKALKAKYAPTPKQSTGSQGNYPLQIESDMSGRAGSQDPPGRRLSQKAASAQTHATRTKKTTFSPKGRQNLRGLCPWILLDMWIVAPVSLRSRRGKGPPTNKNAEKCRTYPLQSTICQGGGRCSCIIREYVTCLFGRSTETRHRVETTSKTPLTCNGGQQLKQETNHYKGGMARQKKVDQGSSKSPFTPRFRHRISGHLRIAPLPAGTVFCRSLAARDLFQVGNLHLARLSVSGKLSQIPVP